MSKFIVGDMVEFTEACTYVQFVGKRAIVVGLVPGRPTMCRQQAYDLDMSGKYAAACECILKLVPPDGDPNEGVEWDWRKLVKAKETT